MISDISVEFCTRGMLSPILAVPETDVTFLCLKCKNEGVYVVHAFGVENQSFEAIE